MKALASQGPAKLFCWGEKARSIKKPHFVRWPIVLCIVLKCISWFLLVANKLLHLHGVVAAIQYRPVEGNGE